ncbi:RNA 2',3'-cyclic phosphodiesterase [Bacillus sp. FJAT-44742]|uniref:RNA 2',3'-cyclic phosphodiesterase n=1 Tax=Bacillus sp. FJAT-44742 TaxID=2014005 RepID=UPI0012FF54EF|nr:RNA 2',3'-cyclic phosphodiesterase [Bacillus sp. FJAT-44742]
MAQHPHYFIGLTVSEEARRDLHTMEQRYSQTLLFKKWVHPQDYHLTLAFLGGSSDSQIEKVKQEVREYVKDVPPFSLALKGVGTFGKKEEPRIFWAGVTDPKELHILQRQVVHACETLGFTFDNKPFRPHITLSRKWKGKGSYQKNVEELQVEKDLTSSSWKVTNCVLFRTHLDRTPKYEIMATFPFGNVEEE